MRSKNESKNELVRAIIDTYQPEIDKYVQRCHCSFDKKFFKICS